MEENQHEDPDLYPIGDGQYLSKSDPEFWSKLLRRKPQHPEALYRVSLAYESEAKDMLERFQQTQSKDDMESYKAKAQEAVEMMAQSLGYGYLKADIELKRMRREHQFTKLPVLTVFKQKGIGWLQTLLLCLLAFLIGILISGGLYIYQNGKATHAKGSTEYIFIPYIFEDETPTFEDERHIEERFVTVSTTDTPQQVTTKMLGVVQHLQVKDDTTRKRIYAVAQTPNGKIQMGVAIFDPIEGMMRVHLNDGDKDYAKVWEATTVLRSAVLQFQKVNGHAPKELSELTKGFPNNFLTGIPFEPISGVDNVFTRMNGEGGWVYRPFRSEGMSQRELEDAVRRSVCPNLEKEIAKPCDIPFDPLEIHIEKDKHILSLVSGKQIISQFPVALGKNDKTPEGEFLIGKKVVNPNKGSDPNPYGTRGLELSDPRYAIHGTNEPNRIGEDVSKGCIRMHDGDIERLYAMVPKNTPVNISKKGSPPADKNPTGEAKPSGGQGSPTKGNPSSVSPSSGESPQSEPTPKGGGSGTNGSGGPSGGGDGEGSPSKGSPSTPPPSDGKGSGNPYPMPTDPKEEDPTQLYGWAG